MKRLSLAGLALSVLLAYGGVANATPFDPIVDFRDSSFAPPSGVDTHFESYLGYNLTFEAMAFDGGGLVHDGTLYWDNDDGFGIRLSYEHDEIEDEEVLRVSFGTSTFVERVLVTDLFLENTYAEEGRFSVDGGSTWSTFYADGAHNNGEVEVSVHAWADSVLFSADGKSNRGSHEFSVAGMDLGLREYEAAMPEPGAALLFGLGLALVRRRVARRT